MMITSLKQINMMALALFVVVLPILPVTDFDKEIPILFFKAIDMQYNY